MIYLVGLLGPIPNGGGTMVLRVVFLFLHAPTSATHSFLLEGLRKRNTNRNTIVPAPLRIGPNTGYITSQPQIAEVRRRLYVSQLHDLTFEGLLMGAQQNFPQDAQRTYRRICDISEQATVLYFIQTSMISSTLSTIYVTSS